MKRALFLIVLLLSCINIQAQNKKELDSLMRVYEQAKHDTTKINALIDIAALYRKKPDTLILLTQKALKMSEKISYIKGQAHSLVELGQTYYDKLDYTQSLEYLQKATKLGEQIKDDALLVRTFNSIAILYDTQGYYPSALTYYQKALFYAEKIHDQYNAATCLTNMGNAYKSLGNYPASIDHYLKGLKIFEEIKNLQGMAYIYNNVGIVYLNQNILTTAEDYFFKSLAIREKINDKRGRASCLNNIGNLYLIEKKPEKALEQYTKSLAIYGEMGDKRGQAIALNNMGDIQNQLLNHQEALVRYQKGLALNEEIKNKWGITYSLIGLAKTESALKQYDKGIEYAEKSLKIAQEIKGLTEIKNAYGHLFKLYKNKGDYEKALEYLLDYTSIKDSILNEKNTKIIANLEGKVKIEREQKEKEVLQKDLKLQQIEAEKERNARLAVEKQAEADQLLAQARQEKDKHKQDSLHTLAQKTQLEADNLKTKEKQLQAESKARRLEIIKEQEARQFQLYLLYLAIGALLIVTILAYFIYLSQQKEKKAKELITIQKEEIAQQKEEINQQRDFLAHQAQELEMANHTKDKLFAILGHDLRSPIGSLEGTLSLMNEGLVSYDEFQDFMPQFHKNVKNMQNTLENLLQWSISQMQGMTATPVPIQLLELIEEKVQLFTEVAKAKNIRFSIEALPTLTVWADLNHVRLLLRNLINNAIKFTPNNGRIQILTYPQDKHVVVDVTDTGVGMSAEQVGKLFSKNQSFTSYGTNGEKGTGLGLQLCAEIVAKNGGTIAVSSEQGKGSTFSFSFPLVSA